MLQQVGQEPLLSARRSFKDAAQELLHLRLKLENHTANYFISPVLLAAISKPIDRSEYEAEEKVETGEKCCVVIADTGYTAIT